MVIESYDNLVKVCPSCKAEIYAGARVCPNCGTRQLRSGAKRRKSRITAAILALLLGGIGAHKFYLGKFFQGILYLFFSWTLIPGIIALCEFVILIAMSDERFDEKYGGQDRDAAPSAGGGFTGMT